MVLAVIVPIQVNAHTSISMRGAYHRQGLLRGAYK